MHGATFRDGKKIVIGLTVRGREADMFWFSLFHELGHVILEHLNQPDGTSAEDEKACDRFAQDTLIPPDDFKDCTSLGFFSKDAISAFAKKENIQSSIVVGRLHKEHFIQYRWCIDQKIKYTLTEYTKVHSVS